MKIKIICIIFLTAAMLYAGSAMAQPRIHKVIVSVNMLQRQNDAKSDTIFYDQSKRLTWADFKGKPVKDHFGGAVTAAGFAFNADIKGDGINVYLNLDVFTFFNKLESWKKKDIQTDYHLQHEQLHFDITRLGAEKFRKAIAAANFTGENYNMLINEIFDKTYAETIDMQQNYDKETRHSINTEIQLKWNERISSEIKKL